MIININPSSWSCFGNLANELGQHLTTILPEGGNWPVISRAQLRIVVQVLLGEDLAEDELDYLRTNLRTSSLAPAMVVTLNTQHIVYVWCWRHVPTEG